MIKPLFRWAGGKTKHIKHIKQYLHPTDTYVEPFFGAGAVFCYVYNQRLAKNFVINDIQKELINLYKDIQQNINPFIASVSIAEDAYLSMPYEKRKEMYYNLRESYWQDPTSEKLFFLMKTSFNGIWQTCVKSKGLFGTPCGLLNEKKPFIDKKLLKDWSIALQSTKIYCKDFEALNIPDNSLVYCDPPYRESFTSYNTDFDDKAQYRCVKWCKDQSTKNNVTTILSNKSDGVFFEQLKETSKIVYFNATHTAGRRKHIIAANGTDKTYEALKVSEILMIWNEKYIKKEEPRQKSIM